jgi:hypothetical protein
VLFMIETLWLFADTSESRAKIREFDYICHYISILVYINTFIYVKN